MFAQDLNHSFFLHAPQNSIVCSVDLTDYNSYGRLVCTLSGLATAQWTPFVWGSRAGQCAGVKVHSRRKQGGGSGGRGGVYISPQNVGNVNIGLLSTYLPRHGQQVEGVVGDSIRRVMRMAGRGLILGYTPIFDRSFAVFFKIINSLLLILVLFQYLAR